MTVRTIELAIEGKWGQTEEGGKGLATGGRIPQWKNEIVTLALSSMEKQNSDLNIILLRKDKDKNKWLWNFESLLQGWIYTSVVH